MEQVMKPLTTADHLQSILTDLNIQKSQKRDFIVPTSDMFYRNGQLWIAKNNGIIASTDVKGAKLTDLCHTQMADKLQIPGQYYKRMMAQHPELLADNINGWLANDRKANRTKYLLRTLDIDPEQSGIARALLSDRYAMLDNFDVLLAALEAIKGMGVKIEVTKAEVTDKRMYLHVVCPDVEVNAEAFLRDYLKENDAVGNGIITGFVLTNSEVGLGGFEIAPRAVICKCNNGLMVKDASFRRIHLGSQMSEGEVAWSERTKQKNYELIISQTQDAVRLFLSAEHLGRMISKIAEAHKIKLEHPYDTAQNVCRELSITEEHKKNILSYFLEDGDVRASGVFQAVTRQAQFMGADDQYEIEAGIGRLLPSIHKFDKPFSKS